MSIDEINEVLSDYRDPNFNAQYDYVDYRYWLESTVEINKPDYIALLNLKLKNPVLYSKNYNLVINGSEDIGIYNIIKSVDKNQIERILDADKKLLQFIENTPDAATNAVFQLRFTADLGDNTSKSFLRSISFIPKRINSTTFYVLLVTLTDITNFLGIQREASADIRYIKSINTRLGDKIEKFKTDLNNVLKPKIKLTNREEEILGLIGLGKTSDKIAQDLSISVNTVNTHRQNLIKKFKVTNTAALLSLI